MSAATSEPAGIVGRLAPSPEQLAAITAGGGDVIVTAGAGTGKTRTLVVRYLRLLEEGASPRRVVAITYTRKAAREMRNRVREAIRDHLRAGDLDRDERLRWRELYTELDAARIGTIHSLCTEILRAHPVEAGLDPGFEVMDEVESALVGYEVVDAALAWAAEDEAASIWFEHLGDRDLPALLAALLTARADARGAFDRTGDDPLSHWRAVLQSAQRRAFGALVGDRGWRQAIADLEAVVADDPGDSFDVRRRAALAAIRDVERAFAAETADSSAPKPWRAALEAAGSDVGKVKLDGGGSKVVHWPNGKADQDAVKEALRTVKAAWEAAPVLALRMGPTDEVLAAGLPALRSIFDHMMTGLVSIERERNRLGFDELEIRALELVREHAGVRAYWRDEILALMVDEFQDANARQRELVELLASDGRRFYVGDAKQSIYRFRGADVTGMRAVRRSIEAGAGTSIALATSYRSHAPLVEALNGLLAPVLGRDDDPARPFVEPFSPLVAHRERPPEGLDGPFVELHLALGTKGDGALGRAAQGLVDRLIELVADRHIAIEGDDGCVRPLAFGDVAILCRRAGAFADYESALARAGVPFVSLSGRGYYERPEVRDLLNALRAIADPHDDAALVGLLRSPAFAVSDVGLYRLVHESGPAPKAREGRSLWTHLEREVRDGGWARDHGGEGGGAGHGDVGSVGVGRGDGDGAGDVGGNDGMGGDDRARLARAWAAVDRLRALAGRVTVGELLAAFLDMTAYRAILHLAGDQRAARNVEKLLDEARASRLVGIGDFVEWVSRVAEAWDRESEAHAVVEGMVHLVTIHSAKGLEFPIVVLGDVASASGGGGADLLVDDELGVLPKLELETNQGAATTAKEKAGAYELAALSAKERDEAENDRLLYVALTRAKDLVLLSGSVDRLKDGALGALAGWLGRLADGLGLDEVDAGSIDPESAAPIRIGTSGARARGAVPVAITVYPEAFAGLRHLPPEPATESTAGSPSELPARMALSDAVERLSPRLAADGDDALEARRDPPRRVWRVVPEAGGRHRAPAWVVGTLVHRALERWRLPGEDPDLGGWLVAITHELGIVDRREADAAVSRSAGLLERFEAHPLRRAIERAERRMHEAPFVSTASDGRPREGRIDLLYRLDGRWNVVDFKADEVRPHTRSRFEALLTDPAEGYARQVAGYAGAVEAMLGERPRGLLCLLDFEGDVRLCEVRAGASAAEILGSSATP